MDRKAIFVSTGIGKNQGGPSGYVYNLVQGAKENRDKIEIITADTELKTQKSNLTSSKKKFTALRSLLYIVKCGIVARRRFSSIIHTFDVIHVHSSQDVYYLKRYIRFKGKIVFTPHRPEPYSMELLKAYRLTFGKENVPQIIMTTGDRIERYSYKNTDRFIFPSEHSRKIYEKFPGFMKYGIGKPTDYLITGTPMRSSTTSRQEFRKQLHINDDAFMITYIGRHNDIKGYDLLTSIADKLETNGVVTVCAGSTEGVTTPQKENWLELGYIDNAPDLMNASDVVVIPNRNTYFDLVIIEALSVGKIVITSNTGGNIDIANETEGLVLFDTGSSEALLDTILKVKDMSKEELNSREQNSYKYYQSNCTLSKFANKYKKIMDRIYANK